MRYVPVPLERLLRTMTKWRISRAIRTNMQKAGLDFHFPEIETWQNQFPGYEILIDDPEFTSVCPKRGFPISA